MQPTSPLSEPASGLVIVGHGMAAQKLLEQLVLLAPDHQIPWPVTIIGEEPHLPYNRIQLSPLLAGETHADDLISQQADWFSLHGITRRSGDPVRQIDRVARCIETASSERIPYQRLVIATGSRPALPLPLPAHLPQALAANHWPSGLMGFRDLKDVEQMQAACLDEGHERAGALVIGGGLLGLEAAEGLRKSGLEVTLLQRSERLMNRQLDEVAAGLLKQELCERGLEIITGAHLDAWLETPEGRITGVRLKDGREMNAELTIAATGIRPEIELARTAGLACQRAIQVDDHLLTSDPQIHALGECCEVNGETFGLIEPIWAQIEVLARQLLEQPTEPYRNAPLATRLKVSGIDLYSCGELVPQLNDEVLIYQDHALGDYRRLLLREDRLVGVVLYGDVSSGNALFEALKAGTSLTRIREELLLMPAEALARLAQDGPPTAPDDPGGKPGTQDMTDKYRDRDTTDASNKTDNTPDTFEEAA